MIILRVDVDLPSNYVVMRGIQRKLSKRCPSLTRVVRELSYYFLNYYRNLVEFAEFLSDYGVEATIFLPDFIYPPKAIKKRVAGFDLGVHVSTGDVESIKETRRRMSSDFGREITKFSAHDISIFKPYEDRFVHLLQNSEFEIFSGNREPLTLSYEKSGGSYYFPEIFYTRVSPTISYYNFNRFDMKWLLKNEKKHTVVVCTHPVELEGRLDGTRETKSRLETVFTECDVTSFEGWLNNYG